MSYKEIAKFQINEERLCVPFDVYQKAVEKTLNRAVFTHELIDPKLKEEINMEGRRKKTWIKSY